MGQRAVPQQPALRPEDVDDARIGLEHVLSGEVGNRFRKAAGVVDRSQNFEPLSRRRLRIVIQDEQIVFHAVARRNVHTARPVVNGRCVSRPSNPSRPFLTATT